MEQSIAKSLAELKKLNPQKKMLLTVFVIILFAASIRFGVRITQKTPVSVPQPAQQNSVSPRPSTRLTLNPSSGDLKVGQAKTFTIDLLELPVTAVDVVLAFDPTIFS